MAGQKVAFLGGGRMGEALLSGLMRSGGRGADDLMVTARREDRVTELSERLGITATLSNTDAVQTFQLPLVALEEQIRRAA